MVSTGRWCWQSVTLCPPHRHSCRPPHHTHTLPPPHTHCTHRGRRWSSSALQPLAPAASAASAHSPPGTEQWPGVWGAAVARSVRSSSGQECGEECGRGSWEGVCVYIAPPQHSSSRLLTPSTSRSPPSSPRPHPFPSVRSTPVDTSHPQPPCPAAFTLLPIDQRHACHAVGHPGPPA
eukprot:352221-Chlamydomonas_euryale.AAC.2